MFAENRLTYSIIGGNIGGAFEVMSDTGEIKVRGELDYEQVSDKRTWVRGGKGVLEEEDTQTSDLSFYSPCIESANKGIKRELLRVLRTLNIW